jgi:hypothetical protein
MLRNNIHGSSIFIVFLFTAFIIFSGTIEAANYIFHPEANKYLLENFKYHDLMVLDTRRDREPIIQYISAFISFPNSAEASHMSLEIYSDQQNKLDYFHETDISH